MSALYSTKVTATGGRSGRIASDDGLLELDLAVPAALGGKGGATNPEQLFAAGYAACFGNAVIHVNRTTHKIADDDVTVVGTVSMAPNADGGFALSVALDVAIAGVDQDSGGFGLAIAKTFDEKGAAAAAVSGIVRIADSPIVADARHAAGGTAA